MAPAHPPPPPGTCAGFGPRQTLPAKWETGAKAHQPAPHPAGPEAEGKAGPRWTNVIGAERHVARVDPGGPAQPFPPVLTGRACASWVEGREVPRTLGVAPGRGSGHWTGRDSRPQGPASWLPGGHPPSPPRLRHHLPAYEDVLAPQPPSSHLLALNVFQGLQQLPSWPRLSPH